MLSADSELDAQRRETAGARQQLERLEGELSRAQAEAARAAADLEAERASAADPVDEKNAAVEGMEAALIRVTEILRRKEVRRACHSRAAAVAKHW